MGFQSARGLAHSKTLSRGRDNVPDLQAIRAALAQPRPSNSGFPFGKDELSWAG